MSFHVHAIGAPSDVAASIRAQADASKTHGIGGQAEILESIASLAERVCKDRDNEREIVTFSAGGHVDSYFGNGEVKFTMHRRAGAPQ